MSNSIGAIELTGVQREGQAYSAACYGARSPAARQGVRGARAWKLPFGIAFNERAGETSLVITTRTNYHMSALQFIVEGGHKLSGTIRPSGNKNAALPIVAAALLSDKPVVLENVPRIRDVETLVQLVQSVGASAE